MSDKNQLYRKLCFSEPTIPIFSQAWWLDAVAGDSWDVVLVEKGDKILASMPYLIKRRYGFNIIGQPPLTQNLGPWLRSSGAKYVKRLSQEKDLLQSLFSQLPEYTYFNQNWYHGRTNWLPLYWKGFDQTTRYTYLIDDLSDLDQVWAGFQENIRREIRKAENKAGIIVRKDLPLSVFLDLNSLTFERQGLTMPYTEDFVIRLVERATKRKQCQWFIAQDSDSKNHAGVLLVWDERSAYYLMGGGDPELRNSGATSLCMWEAIKFASTVTKRFDFEGSMIESVERFFRAFGAVQTPYFTISHTPSKIIKTAKFIKSLKG